MKLRVFILPAITLIAAGVILFGQKHSIGESARQLSQLREKLSQTTRSSVQETRRASRKPLVPVSPNEPIDWMKISGLMIDHTSPNLFGRQQLLALDQRIAAMTQEQLIRALEEIDTQDIPFDAVPLLGGKLMKALAQKDTGTALDLRFRDPFRESSPYLYLRSDEVLTDWAKKDPTAACNWLDHAIANGLMESTALDGSNPRLAQNEAILLSLFIGSNPSVAAKRLEALRPKQRYEAFTQLQSVNKLNHHSFDDQELAEFATLARNYLTPPEQTAQLMGSVTALAKSDGYEGVEAYFDTIQATPEEIGNGLNFIASGVLKISDSKQPPTVADLENFETWAAERTDASAAPAIARTLASSMPQDDSSFESFANAALEFSDHQDDDTALTNFLYLAKSWRNRDVASWLDAHVHDASRREQILSDIETSAPKP
ncbi:hypothetical protein JIN85_13880 [Luteolibacter pohnpeiensis]|uniref:Uncharacterized protein n=1 Tax=Luteolibacter pohnpeiensis TaxID=454153 RepID=A0A934SC94_9BACT|nr:hypothetical protein [Luteolibacter pohnpeiensis]MBK1883512.1 hypothetical protein [Luteolibacter pohnpeiensis]